MYLKEKITNLEREVHIHKTENNRSAAVGAEAQKELDIANRKVEKPSGVVPELQNRLDGLEGLECDRSDRPPLESGPGNS